MAPKHDHEFNPPRARQHLRAAAQWLGRLILMVVVDYGVDQLPPLP